MGRLSLKEVQERNDVWKDVSIPKFLSFFPRPYKSLALNFSQQCTLSFFSLSLQTISLKALPIALGLTGGAVLFSMLADVEASSDCMQPATNRPEMTGKILSYDASRQVIVLYSGDREVLGGEGCTDFLFLFLRPPIPLLLCC